MRSFYFVKNEESGCKMDEKPRKAVPVELENFKDFIRMIASTGRGFTENVAHILVYKDGEDYIFSTLTILPAYYHLRGLPILIYARTKEEPKGSFVKIRATPKEEVGFSSDTTDTTFTYIPLIRVKKLPDFLKI